MYGYIVIVIQSGWELSNSTIPPSLADVVLSIIGADGKEIKVNLSHINYVYYLALEYLFRTFNLPMLMSFP